MVRYFGPLFEQAEKGNGTVLDLVWPGGCTCNPAAVTGWHWDGGKSAVVVIPRTA
jgi:hypothetical protein